MAEFQTVMREFNRLCKGRLCDDCPIWKKHDTTTDICLEWIKDNSVEAEHIVMQWAKENPIKTNRDKFREVFGMDLVVIGHTKDWLDQEYKEKKDEQ